MSRRGAGKKISLWVAVFALVEAELVSARF
jgi:hypothetical protein